MPVPIIVAAAAAAAARLAAKKLAQGAAKKVLPNTIRVSAADRKRIAARKAAANPKKASRPATKIGNEPVSKNNAAGFKAAKAIENKARKEFGMSKGITTGKAKAISKAAKANAHGLKAANKPVSKNNRNRFGDGEMSAYLKSAKPARANRTRLGNTAKKSK